MAEGRMLKKKISLNEAVADLDNDTHRLLFTWAIPHLDIEGRISGSPRVFKATVVPLLDHLTTAKIVNFFKDAHTKGLITYYKVNGEPWIEYPKFKENQNLRESREAASKIPPPPEDSRSSPGVLQELSDNTPAEEKGIEENRIEENTSVHQKADAPRADSNFDTFWSEFPRKENKQTALKVWKKINKNGKGPPFDLLMDALRNQKTWPKWTRDGIFPHASTWLNNQRWLDEPPVETRHSKDDGVQTWLKSGLANS